jgi:hypothetical protein
VREKLVFSPVDVVCLFPELGVRDSFLGEGATDATETDSDPG